MDTNNQARALMMRHHHVIKNRQQSLLSRASAEIGVEFDSEYSGGIQGKPHSSFAKSYDRSGGTLS
jgi:hypothetical protein